MRRIVLLALLSVALPALALVTGAASAEAHRSQTIDATYIARLHARHGHVQYRNGQGTPGHTWQPPGARPGTCGPTCTSSRSTGSTEPSSSRWQGVADCESGGNWHINTGNGHYGGLQLNLGTWHDYGGSGMPHEQAAWRQAEVAERVRTDTGLGAWPHCGSRYTG